MTKNQYQQAVNTYTKRRTELIRRQAVAIASMRKRQRALSKKMDTWKNQLRRIEAREQRVKAAAAIVCEYFSVKTLVNQYGNRKRKMIMVLNVFYKYGIESGIGGKYLSHYTGCKTVPPAANQRRKFTASFRTNKNNLDTWHNFKAYVHSRQQG